MSMLWAVVEPRARRDEEHEVDVDHPSKAPHADRTMNSCGVDPLSKHRIVAAHGRRGATPATLKSFPDLGWDLLLLCTVMAGVLLSSRAAIITCAGSVLGCLALLAIESQGLLPPGARAGLRWTRCRTPRSLGPPDVLEFERKRVESDAFAWI